MRKKIQTWWSTERAKLSPMSFRERASYILHYYRSWFIGMFILICLGFYIGDAVSQSHKEILLQGFFTNDDFGVFPASDIQQDYEQTLQLNQNQRIVFDDSLYVDLGGEASDYTAASNGKIIAYMATKELDFVVTSREVFEYYSQEIPLLDLSQLFSDSVLSDLQEQSIYISQDGEHKLAGLDMTASRFISDEFLQNFPAAEGYYCMFVPISAPHPEQLTDFITYCFSD